MNTLAVLVSAALSYTVPLLDNAGVIVSAKVVVAVENGPVVVQCTLTNVGLTPREVVPDRWSGPFGLELSFSKGRRPNHRDRPFQSTKNVIDDDGLSGAIRIAPGDRPVVRRLYLHDNWIFSPGRTYDLGLCWRFGLQMSDGTVQNRLAISRLKFQVQPDNAKTQQFLFDQLSAVIADERLEYAEYLHWSLVLAGCREPMYRTLALQLLNRQPSHEVGGHRVKLNIGDHRPEYGTETLVAAIYNCSPSRADGTQFIIDAIAEGRAKSVAPFLDFWDRQEQVRRQLMRSWMKTLRLVPGGAEPGLSPLAYTQTNVAVRHPLMHLGDADRERFRAIPNPAVRLLLALHDPKRLNDCKARTAGREFAASLGPIEQAEFDKLIADLRSKSFLVRERAEARLSACGFRLRDQLAERLKEEADSEARARLEKLLKALDTKQVPPICFELVQAAAGADKEVGGSVLRALGRSSLPAPFREHVREVIKRRENRK